MRDSLGIVETALNDYQAGHFGILDATDLRHVVDEAREGRMLRIGCETIVRELDKVVPPEEEVSEEPA